MKRRNVIKKEKEIPQKKKKIIKNKNINLNSDSDSDDINSNEGNKMSSLKINKIKINQINNDKLKENRMLGNKIKTEKIIDDDLFDNNKNKIKKIEDENMYRPQKNKIKKEEDDNMVEFPYEFTERLIDALSCSYCNGIYIRPYVINITGCGHIFCLGCIIKMLENGESGTCQKCKNHFTERNIKYSEVTDYYIRTFFPEIPKIIEENKARLNKFMIEESMKYNENKIQNEQNNLLKCELLPFRENVPPKCRLPEIKNNENKFMIRINSESDNVVNTIKGEVIRRLRMKGNLKEDDIEIRMQGIEISSFDTFESLKNLSINLKENNTFYYSRVAS